MCVCVHECVYTHTHTQWSTSSVVHQTCLDPRPTCCQELDGVVKIVRSSLQFVGGCLILQPWQMSLLPSKEDLFCFFAITKSMMPIHFKCTRSLQWSVDNLKTVVYTCRIKWLTGSVEGYCLWWFFSNGNLSVVERFWLPGKWRWTEAAVGCSQTWPGDVLSKIPMWARIHCRT